MPIWRPYRDAQKWRFLEDVSRHMHFSGLLAGGLPGGGPDARESTKSERPLYTNTRARRHGSQGLQDPLSNLTRRDPLRKLRGRRIHTDFLTFFWYVIGLFTLLNRARWAPYSARTCAQTVPKSSQEMGADGHIWLCKINVLCTTKIQTFFSVRELSQEGAAYPERQRNCLSARLKAMSPSTQRHAQHSTKKSYSVCEKSAGESGLHLTTQGLG